MIAAPLLLVPERRRPKWQSVPWLVSMTIHSLLVGSILFVSIAFSGLPDAPSVKGLTAYVMVSPVPPPPPPPPAALQPRAVATPQPVVATGGTPVPIEAPHTIAPEPAGASYGVPGGIAGGATGGVAWGVIGGVAGGLPAAPPPRPAAPTSPVRVGGDIAAPALVYKAVPVYPATARHAKLSGYVIIEAVVDTEGCVMKTKIISSSAHLFEDAAVEAVRQWRYQPMLLDGRPVSFVLSATVQFAMETR